MMTWKDIKLAVLQKMFAADGTVIPSDESTKDYLAAMPYTANEGILMLSTAGKFLIKSKSISVNPVPNLLGRSVGERIHSKVSGETQFRGDNAKSYYFEVTGKCICDILINNEVIDTIEIDSVNEYVAYKGLIENEENKEVILSFYSEYPYTLKNIGLYEAKYDDAEQIPAFSEKIRYKITDLVDDFHSINSIYFEGSGEKRYIKTDEVFQEGDKILAFDSDVYGNYIVYYNALPKEITSETEDDYELPLDREVAVLLPLYMASQIYKDDDVSIATQYRNEFEVGFERLSIIQPSGKAEKLECESGWI